MQLIPLTMTQAKEIALKWRPVLLAVVASCVGAGVMMCEVRHFGVFMWCVLAWRGVMLYVI